MNTNPPAYLQTQPNDFGQPVGQVLKDWHGVVKPPRQVLTGEHTRLVPVQFERHADSLWQLIQQEPDDSCWTYLPYGPFDTEKMFKNWLEVFLTNQDIVLFAIYSDANYSGAIYSDANVAGWCGLMRADTASGSVEIGHVYYSASLRQTYSATEAMYLLMQQVFDLGYRRCEWKCNDLNEPSKRAALRLGFSHEGLFRQAAVVKGHNRNTAWFSILDSEWPSQREAMKQWLSADNFENDRLANSSFESNCSKDDSVKKPGQQKQSLQQLKKALQAW